MISPKYTLHITIDGGERIDTGIPVTADMDQTLAKQKVKEWLRAYWDAAEKRQTDSERIPKA